METRQIENEKAKNCQYKPENHVIPDFIPKSRKKLMVENARLRKLVVLLSLEQEGKSCRCNGKGNAEHAAGSGSALDRNPA